MTNEEAIVVLQKIKPIPHRGDSKSTTHILETISLDMAIKALKQQPCDDCISRQATIEAIYKKYIGGKDAIKNASINDLYADGLAEAVDAVEEMPSVIPSRPTAQWERLVDDFKKCSRCGRPVKFYRKYKHCPECGARMTEVEK